MNKARLEAFSDGVFAIVITLLILDIRLPGVPYAQLPYLIAIGIAFVSPLVSELIFTLVIVIIGWRTLTDRHLASAAAPIGETGA